MAIQKSTDSSSLAEVVDRILDKGIVIDAFARVSVVGIELITVEARVVIASVDTWLRYAEAVGLLRDEVEEEGIGGRLAEQRLGSQSQDSEESNERGEFSI
ncbi:gas vesicle structural protein GvpA [Halobacillus halophilus]|uniref:Gas vesicle protein A n=1 Tax=Halobacillus halophilus (strain ATCC 35676 / DSM 2266 / JCM 20832 / KCTC 3685 / LMG 17431 / NBRC 102448 / NCIMB 2269) TaxID=866895 RepID=I0JQQ8_HALH3|nr:gas vesicle structural protein GvpA [Halobacillus halophilus]ASF40488.1 gas vesicle protein GvpA [Halobacillus halophilus]MCA1010427.1 gas vesicle structural protein GvpA [Halobacillus halophilus]CCG46478.1 gas vesicle protein GvpA [Halobacillus halophilus DSM 2266]